MKSLAGIVLLLAAALATLLLLPGPNAAYPGMTAITDLRLFDGERLVDDATILIAEGRIVEVGSDLDIPEDARTIPGRGLTVLPGLIDAHVHAYGNARTDALRMGVTTMLDMFRSPGDQPMVIRQRQSLKPTEQADLFSSGMLATAEGGHGTQYGIPVPIPESPDSAGRWVEQRLAEGSDYIKIVIEDGSGWGRPLPTLGQAMVEALVEAAHERNVMAVAHISTLKDAKMAVRAGVDGLVHVFADEPVDESFIQLARNAELWIVPTLAVLSASHGQDVPDWLTDSQFTNGRVTTRQQSMLEMSFPGAQMRQARWPLVLDNVRRLHEAGITLLAGSDSGNPGTSHGPSLHHEMALLTEAGLSPLDALRSATSLPAQAFGLDERGCLRAGCRADLILIDGDPRSDIRKTIRIHSVWKNGSPNDRDQAGGNDA